MTQLGELTDIGHLKDGDVDCPFHQPDHECKADAVRSNYKKGDATRLGNNLKDGDEPHTSTVRRGTSTPDHRHRSNTRELDPDDIDEYEREVHLLKGDKDTEYPVAFAAHHLIPGRASLGRAKKLHPYLRKGSLFCCHLGYDVDGNENGVWLPGLHAVNRQGLNLWSKKVASRNLPDEEGIAKLKARKRKELEAMRNGAPRRSFDYKPLVGPTPADEGDVFARTNLKWLYVKSSMTYHSICRQFHDAHPDYSSKVLQHLESLSNQLDELFEKSRSRANGCAKCAKLRAGRSRPSPPPIDLLGALNRISAWYRRRLVGRIQDDIYFTSSWCGPTAPKVCSKALSG